MRLKKLISYCNDASVKLVPIVNLNNCSGKGDCIIACPYNVFDTRPISEDEKKGLSLKGKIKTFFKRNKAYVINPDSCHSCGLCVQVCPENAIKLVKAFNPLSNKQFV